MGNRKRAKKRAAPKEGKGSQKIFAIYNAAKRNHKPVARIVYSEDAKEMRIDIAEDANPSDLPIMLALFAERGERSLTDKWTRKWVEERVPPQGRQNLGEILRAQGLGSYDEMALLEAASGRSSQDDFLIRRTPEPSCEYALIDAASANPSGKERLSQAGRVGRKAADEAQAQTQTRAQTRAQAQTQAQVHIQAPPPKASRSWCETIGPKIASGRKALGMTQRQLAEKTGIDQAVISRIESGKANPTLDTLDTLVEGIGRSLLVRVV